MKRVAIFLSIFTSFLIALNNDKPNFKNLNFLSYHTFSTINYHLRDSSASLIARYEFGSFGKWVC